MASARREALAPCPRAGWLLASHTVSIPRWTRSAEGTTELSSSLPFLCIHKAQPHSSLCGFQELYLAALPLCTDPAADPEMKQLL